MSASVKVTLQRFGFKSCDCDITTPIHVYLLTPRHRKTLGEQKAFQSKANCRLTNRSYDAMGPMGTNPMMHWERTGQGWVGLGLEQLSTLGCGNCSRSLFKGDGWVGRVWVFVFVVQWDMVGQWPDAMWLGIHAFGQNDRQDWKHYLPTNYVCEL